MLAKEWNDSYSVSVKKFDAQHMKIFELINKLHEAMKTGSSVMVIGEILQSLLLYTETHFVEEENLMIANGYPSIDKQKAQHKVLLDKVLELQQKYQTGFDLVSLSMLNLLYDWLVNHIKVEDKLYGEFFNAKGIF